MLLQLLAVRTETRTWIQRLIGTRSVPSVYAFTHLRRALDLNSPQTSWVLALYGFDHTLYVFRHSSAYTTDWKSGGPYRSTILAQGNPAAPHPLVEALPPDSCLPRGFRHATSGPVQHLL